MSAPPPTDLYDLTIQSHLIVESFLLSQNYTSTASAFRSKAIASGLSLPPLAATSSESTLDPSLDLRHLIESYRSNIRAEERLRKAAQLAATHSTTTIVDPLTLALPGPPTLPFKLEHTHDTLHSSNILSISKLLLPRRRFDTATSAYVKSLEESLVTTAADKRIVFSNPASGEIEEILEDSKNGHQAAVLSVAQDPVDPRCILSSGMDARVIVWDVLARKVVQVLKEHSKFVVKVAFSETGEYLASIGYDKKLIVYRRTQQTAFSATKEGDEEEDVEELEGERYKKVWEKETQTNPESILFVRAALSPPDEEEEGVVPEGGTEKGELVVRQAKQKRTWLCFTVRNDSFIHYVALPTSADTDLSDTLADTNISSKPTNFPDWQLASFNTNPNPLDLHVSYSLLSLSLHPSGLYVCIQTGDHTSPALLSSTSANAPGSLSRLLLLPPLSGARAATVWTGVATSSYAVPRHSWLPSGRGVWLNGEDGVVRLVDLRGRTRASVLAHGVAVREAGEREAAASWSRGGNTIVKDVVALGEAEVASCGFDRTVRIVTIDSSILS